MFPKRLRVGFAAGAADVFPNRPPDCCGCDVAVEAPKRPPDCCGCEDAAGAWPKRPVVFGCCCWVLEAVVFPPLLEGAIVSAPGRNVMADRRMLKMACCARGVLDGRTTKS